MLLDVVVCFMGLAVYGAILFRASHYGYLSPYFLFFLHLTLGCGLRFLFLLFSDDYYGVVLHELVFLDIGSFVLLLLFSVVVFITFEIMAGRVGMAVNAAGWRNVPLAIDLLTYRRLVLLFVFLISIYLALMLVAAGSIGNLVFMFMVRVSSQLSGLGYIGIISDFAILLSIYLFAVSRFLRLKGGDGIVAIIAVSLVLLLLLVQGGRGNIIMYFLSIMIASILIKGQTSIRVGAVFSLVCIVIVVAVLGLTTRIASQQDIEFSEAATRVSGEVVSALSAPFALYDHYYLSELYVERNGFDYGVFYLENLVRPIPRAIWPGKPQVLGKEFRLEFWDDDQGGIPPGVIGELYINFGVAGLFFGAILIGMLLNYMVRMYFSGVRQKSSVLFLSILIPYFCFNLVRGGVDVGFTRLVIYFFLIFLLANIVKFRVSKGG